MVRQTTILALVWSVVLTAAAARAQPLPMSDADGAASDPWAAASIGTHREPDFFVVSSVRCPQRSYGWPPTCDGIVHRYLPDGRYHQSDHEQLISALRPGVPVCLVIHGSFVKAGDLYPESVQRYKRLLASANDRPIHFIAAHWPSDPGLLLLPTLQVYQLGLRAEFNGIYLAQLITRIPPDNPVSLIGHSHGCRVVASALHLLGGGTVQGFAVHNPHPERRMRAVFGAGAIDRHWLNPGQKYGCALNRIECLLNLRNRHDAVLSLYPLQAPLLHHAIGQAGLRVSDLRKMGWQSAKITEFDVTSLIGTGHMISHYARHPQIRAAFIPYLYFD
jgi:hypothetical protein